MPTQNRTDWERHKAQVAAANRARYKAVKKLIAENRDRFDELYAMHCEVEGVTPNPKPHVNADDLLKQIRELEARLHDYGEEQAS